MEIPDNIKEETMNLMVDKFLNSVQPFNSACNEIDEKLKNGDKLSEKKRKALEKKKKELEEESESYKEETKKSMLSEGSPIKNAISNILNTIQEKFNIVNNDVLDISATIPSIATCISIFTSAGASMGLIKNCLGMVTKASSDVQDLNNTLEVAGLNDPETIAKLIPGFDKVMGNIDDLKSQLNDKEGQSEKAEIKAKQKILDDIECPICHEKKLTYIGEENIEVRCENPNCQEVFAFDDLVENDENQ